LAFAIAAIIIFVETNPVIISLISILTPSVPILLYYATKPLTDPRIFKNYQET